MTDLATDPAVDCDGWFKKFMFINKSTVLHFPMVFQWKMGVHMYHVGCENNKRVKKMRVSREG